MSRWGMRAAAPLALLLITAPAAPAADGLRQSGTFAYTTSEPGAPTGYSMAVDFFDPADPNAKPHTLKTLIVRLPAGGVVDTTALPQCKATDAELYLEGSAACPAESRFGGGTVVTDTGSTNDSFPRDVVNDVTQFNNQDEVIGLAESRTDPPVRAVSRSKLEGTTSTTEIPPFPGSPPPEPFTAFRQLRLAVPAIVRDGRAYGRTPRTCPRERSWTIAMTFVYYDGVAQTITSRSPCRRRAESRRRA
jgi:hypothetical protein